MHPITDMQAAVLGFVRFRSIGREDPALDFPHPPLQIDRVRPQGSGKGKPFIRHGLEETRFRGIRGLGSDRGRTNHGAHHFFLTSRDDGADAVEILLFTLRIGLGAPADVVHSEGHRDHRGAFVEDIALQPVHRAGGGIPALPRIEKAHRPLRITHQGIVLHDPGVAPGRRDAVSQERDGIAILKEIVREGRPDRAGKAEENEQYFSHEDQTVGAFRDSTASCPSPYTEA